MSEFKRQRQFVKAVLHAGSGMFSMYVRIPHAVLGACCCVERAICKGCPACIHMYSYTTCISFPELDFARKRGYARLWRSVSIYVAVSVLIIRNNEI